MSYKCVLLDPSLPVNHSLIAPWLGPNTLGIEMTRSEFAKLCGIGNINDQHTEKGGPAAITASLTHPLPLNGAILGTNREDKDSLGAMAILILRLLGLIDKIDRWMVAWIDAVDTLGLKGACREYPELKAHFWHNDEMLAMDTIVHNKSGFWTFEKKVSLVARLLCHEVLDEEIQSILLQKQETKKFDFSKVVEVYGGVAFIPAPGMYRQARGWGNEIYPVTIVSDAVSRRTTIIRQRGVFDRRGVERALNLAEARKRGITVRELLERDLGWGGNPTIVSSGNTLLDKATLLQIVHAHLESGVVT